MCFDELEVFDMGDPPEFDCLVDVIEPMAGRTAQSSRRRTIAASNRR
jgi:hypothetical protein